MRVFALSLFMLLASVASLVEAQSALKDDQRAVMLFDIRMDLIINSKLGKTLELEDKMSAMPGGQMDPSKITRVFGALSAPASVQDVQQMGPGSELPMEFFMRVQFKDSDGLNEMIQMAKDDNGGVVEKNGKTYYKPPAGPGNPPGMLMHQYNDTTVEMGTEAFVFAGEQAPFTAGLRDAFKKAPSNKCVRIVMDMEGAKTFLAEAVDMAKADADLMTKGYLDLVPTMKNLRLTIDVTGGDLIRLETTAVDSDAAENIQGALDSGLALAKMAGAQGLKQLQQMDPGSAKVGKEILDALNAKRDGAEVSVVIPQPKGFEKTVAKMAEMLPMMMMGGGMGPGGPGGPGPGGPGGPGPGAFEGARPPGGGF